MLTCDQIKHSDVMRPQFYCLHRNLRGRQVFVLTCLPCGGRLPRFVTKPAVPVC